MVNLSMCWAPIDPYLQPHNPACPHSVLTLLLSSQFLIPLLLSPLIPSQLFNTRLSIPTLSLLTH
ncbi:unnamed protein product [Hymenolepis diminuta]|uniref:Uncharacterized protein n=1 Tax=Hymenolepis diminuta TaxID=6216 RepID=A0A564ZF25_HYMDI|nr:unnamed protein product [Hymenolepis diminuta]